MPTSFPLPRVCIFIFPTTQILFIDSICYLFVEAVASLKTLVVQELEEGIESDVTRAFILQLVDMMSPLLKLPSIHHPIPATERNTSFVTRLDRLLTDMKYEIRRSENLVYAFRRSLSSGKIHGDRLSCVNSHISATETAIDRSGDKEENAGDAPGNQADEKTTTMKAQEQKLSEFIPRLRSRRKDIENAFWVHSAWKIDKFRAAGQIILRQVQERHRHMSWAYTKERRDLRRAYVPLLAKQLQFSDVGSFGYSSNVSKEESDELLRLSKEVSPIDVPFWSSLAKLEHRRTITHQYVYPMFICRIYSAYCIVHVSLPLYQQSILR